MTTSTSCAPFSRAVVSAMRKLYPEVLADKSWDNTGLLLEAPFTPTRRQANSVLLAIDLTKAVVDEAIQRRDSIVIAYHPIIFKGLKSITLGNSQQQSLLRLAAEGISVYSPHTAIDAAAGGLGDWLADIITGTPIYQLEPQQETPNGEEIPHSRSAIRSLNNPDHPTAGMGRIVRFQSPQPLTSLIERIGHTLGDIKGFPVAIPQGQTMESIQISSIGICAGSGGSLFAGLDVDLLFTGELSHHEALAAIEKGQSVISLFHSNSERGFLKSVLKSQLIKAVGEEWAKIRSDDGGSSSGSSAEMKEALGDESVRIDVSEKDRDPYGIVILKTGN